MNIAVDIGNTRVKCGLFDPDGKNDALKVWDCQIPSKGGEWDTDSFLHELLFWKDEVITWWIAQTGSLSWKKLKKTVCHIRPQDKFRTVDHRWIPFKIDVDEPEKVGIDRLLAALAATIRYGNSPMLIVDAGSAITVDVFEKGVFYGGAILPGLASLSATYPKISNKLPFVAIPDSFTETRPVYPGKNTEDAILNGLYWGTIGAIRQFYETLREHDALLVLTGGDADYLLPGLAQEVPFQQIRHHPHLVLEGINRCRFQNRLPSSSPR